MKMIIGISGGVVCNIQSTEPCQIYIVDHDALKEHDKAIYEIGSYQEPDIIAESEIEGILLTHVDTYREV